MADWEMIAKGLSAAGKTFATSLENMNQMRMRETYDINAENRAKDREQALFERNRAAEMADYRTRQEEDAKRRELFAKREREDIAELALWDNDPNLRSYVETIGRAADTFGDPVQRRIFNGVNKLRNKVRAGAIEGELDQEEQLALDNLPPQLGSTLNSAILKNQAARDQHLQSKKMLEYYTWLMKDRDTQVEKLKLTYGQFKDANDYRMKLFEHINKLETEETFLDGRQHAMSKYGIDPNQDPDKFPEWEKIIGKGGKDATLLMAYADRWRQIAVFKKMLYDVNEQMFRLDPTSDPQRMFEMIAEKELGKKMGPYYQEPIPPGEERFPPPIVPLGIVPHDKRPAWQRVFSRIVGSEVPQTLKNIVGGIFTNEETRSFYKHMEKKYGIPPNAGVDIAFSRAALTKLDRDRDIGRLFYDVNSDKVYRIESSADSPSGIGVEEIVPLKSWVEPKETKDWRAEMKRAMSGWEK